MVTWNISTDADLSNGTRGEIVDILLDPQEDTRTIDGSKVTLKYPPTMIMFKPTNSATIEFTGLVKGLIPIFLTESTFPVMTFPTLYY